MSENEYANLLPDVEPVADGVEVVEDVADQPGIETLEGRMGLLLQGEAMQAHFIEMPPGMFTPEHAHETESISRFDFFLYCDVEVVRAVTLVERGFLAFPVVRPILRKRRAVLVVRCDELGGHAVAHGGERNVVVVVGDGAPVVHDDTSSELRLACLFYRRR